MATKIGSLLIKLAVEHGMLKSGLSIAEKEVAKTTKAIERRGREIASFGKKMSIAVTAPMIAIGAQSFKAAVQSREAIAQVEARLKSMGDASGKSAEDLKKAAKALETFSNFDDDDILRDVTANLLTFGRVSGPIFDRAQQAIVDLSEGFGQSLKTSSVQVGKALQDPVKGLAALTKVGLTFTNAQKETIKRMVEMGDVTGAQTELLKALEGQFKGSAKAAREAAPGGDLQQQWRTLQEIIGERLVQAFERLEKVIAPVLRSFNELSPNTQTAIVVIGALAAAIGPLMIMFGLAIQSMAPFLATIKLLGASGGFMVAAKAAIVGLTSVFWPLAAAVLAIYLAWQNWDTIKPVLIDLWNQFRALAEGLGLVESNAEASADEIERYADMRRVGEQIRELGEYLDDLAQDFADLEKGAYEFGDAFYDAIGAGWRKFEEFTQRLNAFGASVAAGFRSMRDGAVQAVRDLYNGVKTWLLDRLGGVFDGVGRRVGQVTGFFRDMYIAVVGNSYVPDMVDGIARHMGRLEQSMVDPARKAARSVSEEMRAMAAETQALLDRLFPEVRRLLDYRREMGLLDKAGLSADELGEARFRLGREFAGQADKPNYTVVTNQGSIAASTNEAARAVEGLARKSRLATVQIAKSFKDMADDTMAALRRMTDAIKGGGFLDILSAVLGFGLQLGSIGAFGSKIASNINRPRAYARGTSYHPGGWAVVGEEGPELVNLRRGAQVFSNAQSSALMAGRGGIAEIVPSPYFDVVVDGRVQRQAPGIASAGAGMAHSQAAKAGKWRLE